VNGFALGSGYELALACDIRIAAEGAKFGSPEARVSSSVTGGAMRLVQDLVGPGKARELLFTCDYIDGKEAERIGLVNKAVPPERLMEESMAMAKKIASNSQFSINLIKKGLNMASEVSLEALMDYEVEACLATVSAPERMDKLEEFADRKKQ
jgi:enoyl-CoA hydratase